MLAYRLLLLFDVLFAKDIMSFINSGKESAYKALRVLSNDNQINSWCLPRLRRDLSYAVIRLKPKIQSTGNARKQQV